jgi:ABC-2 type transport system ATP-binding protein
MQDLSAMSEVRSCYSFGSEHHVMFNDPDQSVEAIAKRLTGHPNLTVRRIEPTIEDCFMDLMKSK